MKRSGNQAAARAAAAVFLALFLASCGGSKETPKPAPGKAPEKPRFGLVVGYGGLNDKAFNDMHFNGMMAASKEYGVEFDYEVPANDNDYEAPAERLIAKGCSVIIAGAGFFMTDAVDSLSAKHAGVTFVLDDAEAKTYRPNVASITYRQNEGSFLAGALAAKVSKSGKVAVFGAANVPVINDFMVGFAAGARHARPGVAVEEAYIDARLAETGEGHAWNAPKLAKKMALESYARGVDVIFQVASGSGLGVFLAAEETGKWAIGVDSDQDYLFEGKILTSMMKNVDKSMVFITGEILAGRLQNRNYALGIKEGGVGLTPMAYSRSKVDPAVLEYMERLREDIVSRAVLVPSAF